MKKGTKLQTPYNELEIIEQLGQGGVGTVYKAKDSDGNLVAVKVFNPSNLGSTKLKRFKNEVEFLRKIEHKNIVKVIDDGFVEIRSQKCPFYVMPVYECSLRNLMKKGLEPEKVCKYFGDILDGIEAAHLNNSWHRDLKPENILIDSSKDTAIVADFGAAHFSQEILYTLIETSQSDRLANFQYASPEQRQKGDSIDHRSDIFSLGLLVSEMFTGNIPHGQDYRKVADVSKDHSYFDDVINKMLSQEPSKRPSSIEDVKAFLINQKDQQISLQRISHLDNTVINDHGIDDPIYNDPVKALHYDFQFRNGLTIELSHDVTGDWEKVFKHRAAGPFSSAHNPNMVRFNRKFATLPSREDNAGQAKNLFEQWINKTNSIYREEIEKHHRKKLEEKKRELERRRAEEKKRLELNKRLNS